MTKDEELSRYMALIEYYKEQLSLLDTQMSYVQAAMNDYAKAKITVDHLQQQEKDAELVMPIGGSTFVYAKAADPAKVLFDIGSGIVTEKTAEDAMKKIDERIEQLQQTQEKLSSMIQQVQTEAQEVSEKAQKLATEQNR
ncbi:MAG: prefoldin subunit alpha [Candidatus Thermoplasmatota archaeon]|nr:prefoldin subunit alpha [Candidatus Thermoplasmatota archaeon]